MRDYFRSFFGDEDGAVTVDWVVMTAAVVGLSVTVVGILQQDSNDLSGLIGDYLEEQDPSTNGNIQD